MLPAHPPLLAADHVALNGQPWANSPAAARRSWSGRWHWAFVAPLAVVTVLGVGLTAASVPVLYLSIVTPSLVRTDLSQHRLPNALTLPGIAIGLVTWAVRSAMDGGVHSFPLVAALGYAAALLVLALLGGMGVGDVKLAAVIGFAAWTPLVAVGSVVIAFLTAGVASLVVLVRHGRGRRMAFGPYLLAGYWAAAIIVAAASPG